MRSMACPLLGRFGTLEVTLAPFFPRSHPMKLTPLLFLAAGLLIAADEKKDDVAKKDVETLQGEWAMNSHEFNGEKLAEEKIKDYKRTVKDDHFTVVLGDKTVVEGTFTLDASKKPKTIDITLENVDLKGKKMLGIYEIDGDTYKVCLGAPDIERPTEFVSKPDSSQALTTWKRVKK
jgi:uncharacterized protein (TIGR03067 family)